MRSVLQCRPINSYAPLIIDRWSQLSHMERMPVKLPQSLAALIVTILACVLTACTSAVTPATDSEELEAARAAVFAKTLEWHDAWEDLEPDPVLALYAPDVRYYWFG